LLGIGGIASRDRSAMAFGAARFSSVALGAWWAYATATVARVGPPPVPADDKKPNSLK